MKKSMFALLSLAALFAIPTADAADECRRFTTTASYQIFPPDQCPESPFGLCSEATLHSGPLRGTYTYGVDDLSVGAGLTSLPPSSLAVSGEFVLETRKGTATGIKTAIFDVVSGQQITLYKLTSGPWTGTFFASGFFDPATQAGSRRDNLIWGVVCRAD